MRPYGEGAITTLLGLVKQKKYATLITVILRATGIRTRQATIIFCSFQFVTHKYLTTAAVGMRNRYVNML